MEQSQKKRKRKPRIFSRDLLFYHTIYKSRDFQKRKLSSGVLKIDNIERGIILNLIAFITPTDAVISVGFLQQFHRNGVIRFSKALREKNIFNAAFFSFFF